MFSICLCSWNDIDFLKILVKGLKRNTKLPYELIVHDNGSEDGTENWLKENNIKHSKSDKNEGVAAVNYAVKQASYGYVIDINADMYPLPGWDIEIYKQIQKFKQQKINKFMISSCLIEPYGNNPEYTTLYHGHNPDTFNENALLQDYIVNYKRYEKINTIQYSHPITIPKKLWQEFGGVDTTYQYGVGTDHEIPASAYKHGCRSFIMLGNSRVYHFVNQTIKKLPQNRENGEKTFYNKWGLTIEEFRKKMKIAHPFCIVDNNIL